MIPYIIKSSLCLLLLWGVYKLFLENESMHRYKRYYLLFSLVTAFTIPLITLTYQTDAAVETITPEEIIIPIAAAQIDLVQKPSVAYTTIVLYSIYGIGVLFFGIRFIKNIYSLRQKIKNNKKLHKRLHTNVLLPETVIPHTFLRYIFVTKKAFKKGTIPPEVLLHEEAHVTQKHTLDILFIEALQIIFWFNPLLIWVKRAIKLNHEFLADQTVIKQEVPLKSYQYLLINYPNSLNQTVLSSAINYSLTKKRIIMMSQQFSRNRAALRMLLLLPTLIGCLLLFNNEIVAQQKSNPTTLAETHPDKKILIRVKKDQITVNGTSTELSNFATTIDEMTKQWKNDELTEFQFDIQIINSDDDFLQQLNDAYRNTRLYKANPDGHDLIPPPPPAPKIRKGEESHIPPPPPPAPMVKKGKKSSIPPPPAPKVRKREKSGIPAPPSTAIHKKHEQEVELHIEMAEEARHSAIIKQERAYEEREKAMISAEQARAIAMEAAHSVRERSHEIREEAMRNAEVARYHAEIESIERSKMAMQVAEEARAMARVSREEASIQAKRAMEHAREAMKEARKAQMEARKEQLEAVKEIRSAEMKARKKEIKKRKKELKAIDKEEN